MERYHVLYHEKRYEKRHVAQPSDCLEASRPIHGDENNYMKLPIQRVGHLNSE